MNEELIECLTDLKRVKPHSETKELQMSFIELKTILIEHFGLKVQQKVSPTLTFMEGKRIIRKPKPKIVFIDFERLETVIEQLRAAE